MSYAHKTVLCDTCSTEIVQETGEAIPFENRAPCPNCGSLKRIVWLEHHDLSLTLTSEEVQPEPSPRALLEAIRSGQADVVYEVRVVRLDDGAFVAEISDSETDMHTVIGQLSWDDLAVAIAADLDDRRKPS
jgi:hypothetical protein